MGAKSDTELYLQVKKLIIGAVKLKKAPEEIGDNEVLFGEGLGLDSVDALELVIAIEKEFGLKIPDAAVGAQALASVQSIVEYVKKQKHG